MPSESGSRSSRRSPSANAGGSHCLAALALDASIYEGWVGPRGTARLSDQPGGHPLRRNVRIAWVNRGGPRFGAADYSGAGLRASEIAAGVRATAVRG